MQRRCTADQSACARTRAAATSTMGPSSNSSASRRDAASPACCKDASIRRTSRRSEPEYRCGRPTSEASAACSSAVRLVDSDVLYRLARAVHARSSDAGAGAARRGRRRRAARCRRASARHALMPARTAGRGRPRRFSPCRPSVQRETKTASMPFAALQLADRDAGQLGVAGPFALAGDDEVEVELADQPHAVGTGGVVDAGEGFVEQHQPRRKRVVALAVEARDGGEQRHREAERTFAAGGRPGQLAPAGRPASVRRGSGASGDSRARARADRAGCRRRPPTESARSRSAAMRCCSMAPTTRRSSADHRSALVLSRRLRAASRPTGAPSSSASGCHSSR